ncbi:MAG: hypothetical protein JXB13_07145 [Phycisphaerae bacterium]|nr:hypothetical protein [Phycisphaerae bacterium]
MGQSAYGSASFLLNADLDPGTSGLLWQVSGGETYLGPQVRSRLVTLAYGAREYADNHGGAMPALASDLFSLGLVTDPRVFYNPGDSDSPPTTIDNDIPDTPNSALISFDFPLAGATTWQLTDTLFIDNSPENNFGMGWYRVSAGRQSEFIPRNPRPAFQGATLVVTPSTPFSLMIWEPTLQITPYEMGVLPGMEARTTVAPHRFELLATGAFSPEIISVFQQEGFGEQNRCVASTLAYTYLPVTALHNPSGTASIQAHMALSGTLTRRNGDWENAMTIGAVSAILGWLPSELPSQTAMALIIFTADGLRWSPDVRMLALSEVGPGQAGYVSEAKTFSFAAIVQLELEVPAEQEGRVQIGANAGAPVPVDPAAATAIYNRAEVTATLHAPAYADRVKLVVSPGTSWTVDVQDGPADLFVPVLKGDHDADGDVDDVDRTAFITTYTGPLVSSDYSPPSNEFYRDFDFDGDGDVDCADETAFRAAWTVGGTPARIPVCAADSDADGIPNGDDDCSGTPAGTLVDERGCPVGDYDADGTLTQSDFESLLECLTGPGIPEPQLGLVLNHVLPACENAFDRDHDHDVDLLDVAKWDADRAGY